MSMNTFLHKKVTVQNMMDARDARAQRQHAWAREYGVPMVFLTMNIAGPVKVTPLIEQGFDMAVRKITAQLARHGAGITAWERISACTGMEMIWAVAFDALKIKRMMADVEERESFGRLLDIDVIDVDGRKISRDEIGMPPRLCLICGCDAMACARSRAHTVEALFEKTEAILKLAIHGRIADRVSAIAQRALLYEVTVTPKPGLVDRQNNGAHQDMDFFTFLQSASVLTAYFRACVQKGLEGEALQEVFRSLRYLGMCAEEDMLAATQGVNAHKGAIFSLGILCGAVGWLMAKQSVLTPDAVCAACVDMTNEILQAEMAQMEAPFGARKEAALGFPTVIRHGLPAYEEARRMGKSINDAGVYSLLALLAATMDANVARRSSIARARELQEEAGAILAACTMKAVHGLDTRLIQENISPGGCADLLAAVFFLDEIRSLELDR